VFLPANILIYEGERKGGGRISSSSPTPSLERDCKCVPFMDATLTRPNGMKLKSISSSPFKGHTAK
jgi:hypothetical protein